MGWKIAGWPRRLGLMLQVLLLALASACGYETVAPGNVGIVVDYNKEQPTTVLPGHGFWNFSGAVSVIQYPISQQSLVMVRTFGEGKVQGDDSVACQDKDLIAINIDTTAYWRVDPDKVINLYFLRPGLPLTSKTDQDIEDQLVRPAVRSAVYLSCPKFAYTDIAISREQLQIMALASARDILAKQFIIVDDLLMRGVYFGEAQNAAIAARAENAKNLEAAEALRVKAVKDAETTKIQADSKAANDLIQAKSTADQKAIQVASETDEITKRAQAQSAANRQLAESLSPAVLEHEKLNKWDGKLPTTELSGTPSVVVQHP